MEHLKGVNPQSLHKPNEQIEAYDIAINALKRQEAWHEGSEVPKTPRFKAHDWVVDGDRVAIIYDLQKNGYVGHDANRIDFVCRYSDESRLRLWSIQDAKDGDVLATDNGWTCIFKAFDGWTFSSYCFMDSQNWFYEFGSEVHTPDSRLNGNIHPATKEQRDLFFKKMREAGYEWDADKKELRKTIDEPIFKVGDEIFRPACNEYFKIKDIEKDNGTVWYVTTRTRITYNDGRTGGIIRINARYQNEYNIAPKSHYDIANFHEGMPVLVRDDNSDEWNYLFFSHYRKKFSDHFFVGGSPWRQCVPFSEDTKHLLGTTDPCDERYVNW